MCEPNNGVTDRKKTRTNNTTLYLRIAHKITKYTTTDLRVLTDTETKSKAIKN